MKIHPIKLLSAIAFIAAITLALYSCKKNTAPANNEDAATAKAKAIQATIERYGRVTAPVIFQPRQPASSISYRDASGNMVMYGGSQNRTEATCGQYTCSTTQDPNDLYVTYTLEYVKWYYTCGTGHDLTAI